MTATPIMPQGITLFVTLRCTAACDNCCFGCTPTQGRSMTLEEMMNYVDMSLEAYPDTLKSLDLTGGECMLLGKNIDKILAYGKSKGLKGSMVSNAFWATDYDKAYKTLKRLKRNGLTQIALSTGKDHNAYVPWKNVRNAAVAASHLGLVTELRVEYQYGFRTILDEFYRDAEVMDLVNSGKIIFTKNVWMRYHNKRKKPRNVKLRYYNFDECTPCKFLFSKIIINPYGEVYACCGIGVCHIPQMRLGNVNKEPIQTIYERAFDDFLKIWLYTHGPKAILKYVHEKTGQAFNWYSTHACDMCRAIFMDKTILPVVRENFFDAAYSAIDLYEIEAKTHNESSAKR
jgi:MoaA/NifB/PqqE/SkfB family radical SAM enzyme